MVVSINPNAVNPHFIFPADMLSNQSVASTAEDIIALLDALPVQVTHVTAISREARRGGVFLAYPGATNDGRAFIADAISRGVSAVLYEAGFDWYANSELGNTVPHAAVKNLKRFASLIAGHVYQNPSNDLWMIGVTGTNGKTSVSQWIAQALATTSKRSAVVGTIGNGFVEQLTAAENTTPDAVMLQRLLRDYVNAGAQACAMEVSSHGLDQGRAADVKFDIAVFTNLTRDHLDYHLTMEAYGAAKARLFQSRGLKTAVINVDDPFGRKLAEDISNNGSNVRVVRFACNGGSKFANLTGANLSVSPSGLSFTVRLLGDTKQEARVDSAILGAFNISNLLAVIGALLASGVNLAAAAKIASELKPVPGRMQTVRSGQKGGDANRPLVVVDYAHTPDALEKALSTLAAVVPDKGRLISVFGCGGDRDRGKRPLMGAVSAQFADLTIVTSDNPRTEDAQRIIADIEPGMIGAAYRVVADRYQAIYEALNAANQSDIVLIAGKGHEDYQIIGESKQHFSDVEVAVEALAQWKGPSP